MVIIKTTIIVLDIIGLHMSNILHSDICFFYFLHIDNIYLCTWTLALYFLSEKGSLDGRNWAQDKYPQGAA